MNSNKQTDLNLDELKKFCEKLHITESEFEVKLIFGLFDVNKSLRISEEEFVKELELVDYRLIFVTKKLFFFVFENNNLPFLVSKPRIYRYSSSFTLRS